MHTSIITSKGQVTIPAEMRRRLGLAAGQRVAFGFKDGRIVLEAVKNDISASFGLLKADRYVSDEQMEQDVATAANERFNDTSGPAENGRR